MPIGTSLWIKQTMNEDGSIGITVVLVYSNDWLFASTSPKLWESFRKAHISHFDVDFQGHATRYLQAAITQDKQGNIYLDRKGMLYPLCRRTFLQL